MASKGCESDAIPTSMLKKILPSILDLITEIVNTSLESGIFVSSWKTAIVHPLLKKARFRTSHQKLQTGQ